MAVMVAGPRSLLSVPARPTRRAMATGADWEVGAPHPTATRHEPLAAPQCERFLVPFAFRHAARGPAPRGGGATLPKPPAGGGARHRARSPGQPNHPSRRGVLRG